MTPSIPPSVPPTDRTTEPPVEGLRRFRTRAAIVGAVFLVLSILGALIDPLQLLRSYLVAVVFWLSVALGCLGIEMMGHVAPGGWTIVLRRPLEAASRTIVPLFVLFLPILVGVRRLYPWARPDAAEVPEIAAKSAYLNIPFFVVRAVLYFAIWTALAHGISRMSAREDHNADPELPRRLRKVSAAGLVLYCLTMTFASIDWLMSLTPRWYSTIYGIYVIGGQAVAGMAFAIVVALVLVRNRPSAPILTHHFHDSGKMLLAFVMLWAYFAFSQLLVQWSGNLPEEVPYYVPRLAGRYTWLSVVLLVMHFATPFLLLLSRDLKRDAGRLAAVAGLLLVMRWVDFYWLIVPSTDIGSPRLHWLDLVAFAAVGATWLAFYAAELSRRPLLPLGEPLLAEALEQHD